MEPVFQLSELLTRYVRSEIDLRALQEGFVPLLPYFAERQHADPFARMAVDVDSVLVDIMTGEAVEDDLRALVEAMPNPTLTITSPSEPPRGATSSTVLEWPVRPITGIVRWSISAGASHATPAHTAPGAALA